ncbi:MAG: hypothetical protein RBT19_15215 [Tenuifilaceae bacterium]|jgi:hypothetical protein|nr:hypothetical protein [Tenuifilaceae bacterium]
MRRLIAILLVTVSCAPSLSSQSRYKLASETIVSKPEELKRLQGNRIYRIAGYNSGQIVYQLRQDSKFSGYAYSDEAATKLYYDERMGKVVDTVAIERRGRSVYDFIQIDDLTLYRGKYQLPLDCLDLNKDDLDRTELDRVDELLDYQDFWIEVNGKEKKIKSFSSDYYDVDLYYNICYTGDCVTLNDYVSEYLRSTEADSIITVFSVQNGQVTSKELYCRECIAPQIVNEQLFYGKKFFYFPGTDAYDWKVYRASKFDLPKSELLAEYIEILLVSPDGKYILGKKNLQGKDVAVILDVEAKKFDYLLGRDYLTYKYFYSPTYKKFAFDTQDHIIYINNPVEFPFNSVGEDAERKRTSKSEKAEFWKNYIHPELQQE